MLPARRERQPTLIMTSLIKKTPPCAEFFYMYFFPQSLQHHNVKQQIGKDLYPNIHRACITLTAAIAGPAAPVIASPGPPSRPYMIGLRLHKSPYPLVRQGHPKPRMFTPRPGQPGTHPVTAIPIYRSRIQLLHHLFGTLITR